MQNNTSCIISSLTVQEQRWATISAGWISVHSCVTIIQNLITSFGQMRLAYTCMVMLIVIIVEFWQIRGQNITWRNIYIHRKFAISLVSLQLLNCNHFSSNCYNYLKMLLEHLTPQLARKRKLSSTIFMEDGALSHYASITWNYLDRFFSKERVISRDCDISQARVLNNDALKDLTSLKDRTNEVCNDITIC